MARAWISAVFVAALAAVDKADIASDASMRTDTIFRIASMTKSSRPPT